MRGLDFVLKTKIALTVVAWCVPLLLFPASFLGQLGFPVPVPEVFTRLLGMAYLALVLGYWFGFQQLRGGMYPSPTVWVGILSNGGAFTLLAIYAVHGAWSGWGAFAQSFMWASLAGTGAITAGLIAFGPCGAQAGRSVPDRDPPAA